MSFLKLITFFSSNYSVILSFFVPIGEEKRGKKHRALFPTYKMGVPVNCETKYSETKRNSQK